jgi:hypothetical protein
MAVAAGLTAGTVACGQVSAGGGQPVAPTPPGAGAAQSATAPARTTVSASAGSATAGTGSAAPAITVSGPATVTTAGPPPTASPTLTGLVTLTAADNGAVLDLRVGQQVRVVLSAAFMSWHLPGAAGAALRRVSASGGFPGHQPARAVFLAVEPGTVTLADMSDAACLHTHPKCMIPQELWQVTVRVSG